MSEDLELQDKVNAKQGLSSAKGAMLQRLVIRNFRSDENGNDS